MTSARRILLIDPDDTRREVVARRLLAQGFAPEEASDAAVGAHMALSAPPAAVIADLWMPSISGVQLCRLLRSETATADVPVILCGDVDEPRNRFWAERAGASAYVIKGRTGDLVRAVTSATQVSKSSSAFFVQLSGGTIDIRERIARHLDAALFESVISAEIRSLASAGSFERLFDQLAQFMSQVTRYRWIALFTPMPRRLAIHHHPSMRALAESEAKRALGLDEDVARFNVEDEDAIEQNEGPLAMVADVRFSYALVARFALGPSIEREEDAESLVAIVGRELGGAVKIATLIEESQRLASIDMLTQLMNRRAFGAVMKTELARSGRYGYPLCFALLDVDHFKHINDQRGHAGGDRVLAAIGSLLGNFLRGTDYAVRWGGEEFGIAYTSTELGGAKLAAERLREAIEKLVVFDDNNQPIPITASIGLAAWHSDESLDALVARADAAMYVSKSAGRNRVSVCVQDATNEEQSARTSAH